MSKPSDNPAHPYEPEPYPILHAWPKYWWMEELEKAALEESLARAYGGEGLRPREGGRER